MSEEILSSADRDYAQTRENSWNKFKIEIAQNYAAAYDKAAVTGPTQRYVDENEMSLDPVAQGRVTAYVEFLESLGRTQ